MKMMRSGKKSGMPVNRKDARKLKNSSRMKKWTLLKVRMTPKRKKPRILDKDIANHNYARFTACTICGDGHKIEFSYPVGDSYCVDINEFESWYNSPHLIIDKTGSAIDWPQGKAYRPQRKRCFAHAELALSGFTIRVLLSDQTGYYVAWDTVLMACEPRYQWYGGLPAHIKEMNTESGHH